MGQYSMLILDTNVLYCSASTELTTIVEPRKSGPGEHNTTAFCQAQRDWSLDRTKWHLIQDNVLNRLERKEYGTNQTAVLGPMMWNNCVVIDHDNQ